MAFTIRQGTKQDAPATYQLIAELAKYENAPHEHSISYQQFAEDGFGEKPKYRLLVAENKQNNEIIGIALFYDAYSTWKGKIIYLDDLVVTQVYRRSGVGQQLINAVLDLARSENANQVRWHVLDWNEPAIQFYKNMGVKMEKEWITCKCESELLYP